MIRRILLSLQTAFFGFASNWMRRPRRAQGSVLYLRPIGIVSMTGAAFLLLLALVLFGLAGCASNSGIFSGGSWQAGSLQNQHLQVLAVDPNHLQAVYAGDASNGVFASTDAGKTWKPSSAGLPAPVAVNALAFDIPGKKLYAATSTGLFVSSDSALSWSQVAHLPSDSYTALTFDVNSPRVVYVATAHSGVFSSPDDGTSWTHISNGLPAGAITSILYDSDQKQLWAGLANGLYRSDDNGANWHTMSNGLPVNVGINALALGAVIGSKSDLIFAATNHGFFLSNDAGQHWTQSQFSLANLQVHAVLLDATQPNVVYASTTIGVLRSNDNGQNWNQVAPGLPGDQPFYGLAQGGDNYTQLFLASRGIYLYPGSGSAFDPSRVFPIILILLFFFLLYYFFVLRRRRPVGRSPLRSGPTTVDETPVAGNIQNGHGPMPDGVPDARSDEKKEL